MLHSTFGISTLPTSSIHQITSDTIAYLTGFSVIFHNFIENKTVSTLILGENILKIAQIQFFNNNTTMLSTETRPEGACVSIYERNQSGIFVFKHRIFIAVKTNQGMKIVKEIILAHFVTENRLLVITDFSSGYQMLIYDNDQKTTSLPTYSLKITQSDIIDSKIEQTIETLKIVQLTDKELLFISNSTVKFIKLASGTAKVLSPNNLQLLNGQKTFTDAIFLNKNLLKKYTNFPVDSDKLILLTTKDGSICVIFNNTLIAEFKCSIVKESQFNQINFINDPVVFLNQQKQQNNFFDEGNPARTNFSFFNQELTNLTLPERSSAFLAISGSKGCIHFYGLQLSEFFRFIVKNVYSGSTNWEKQFDANKFFLHLMSFSCSSVIDSLLSRTNPPFDVNNAILTKNERFLVGFGLNSSQKLIFGVKLPAIIKRLMEIDGLRAQFILQSRDLSTLKDVIRTMLTNQTEEVKKLISQDQLTIINGEITDLNTMDAELININFISNNQSLDQSLPYSYTRNPELWLIAPIFTNNTIVSISNSIFHSTLAILSNDRIIRIFDQTTLQEYSFCRFPDTANSLLFHPTNQFLALSGSDFLLLTQLYTDRLTKLHQFNIQFCKVMAFSHSGDLFLAASGIHLHVFDFYTREELYKIEDFPSRITVILPIFRDFSSGKYEIFFWICCADGSVCVFDAGSGKRERSVSLRGMHCLVGCQCGVAGVRVEGEINENLPKNPVIFCIMTDASIRVFDYSVKELGVLVVHLANEGVVGVGNSLNLIEIRGSASNDVICSINDGKNDQRKVFKGRPVMMVQMVQFLIIAYEQGYVIVKNVKNLLDGVNNGGEVKLNDLESEEIVIPINCTRITGLQAMYDNTGFIVSTEDGLVFSFKLKNFIQPKVLVQQKASISQTQEKNSVISAQFQPFTVHQNQLNQIYHSIISSKNTIFDTKKSLQTQLHFLDTQFQIDLNKIINTTNDSISTHLSEHSRLKTDHDNKAILLKRQIANNENLFKDSKRALENQYQKRLILMQEQVSELQNKQIGVEQDLEMQEIGFQNETNSRISDFKQSREEDLASLTAEITQINNQITFLTEQNEMIYKLSENQLYTDCDSYQSFYSQKITDLQNQTEAVKQTNYQTKADYKQLESNLIVQKKLLSTREMEISDLKSKISELKKAINENKNEILNRDQTISQREKRVIELNQKIRELNKISFILQFKIRELKRTIQPKDQERADLKIKMKEMSVEMGNYRLNLMQLQSNKKELERKIGALKEQIKNQDCDKEQILKKLNEIRVSVNGMKKTLDMQQTTQKSIASLPNLQYAKSQQNIASVANIANQNIGVDKNQFYKQLVTEIKKIDMTLTQKPNQLVQQREADEVNGNFSKLEANVVKLQQKVTANNSQTKSSTSGVMQQNALLLQEINQLRRELHQAQVQANSDCKIDESLLDRYEENRSEILRLRNVIRAKERQAKVGGAFLPEIN